MKFLFYTLFIVCYKLFTKKYQAADELLTKFQKLKILKIIKYEEIKKL